MPYRQVWEPAPKDERIEVAKADREHPPNGLTVDPFTLASFSRVPEASGICVHCNSYEVFYHCRHCEGWIQGHPNKFEVDTLAPAQLAGRRGTEFYCRRCGQEIGFMGVMS